MTTFNITTERIECINAMNNLMIYVGSDESFDKWLEFLPDGLQEDVFKSIAEDDDMYMNLCDLFFRLMRRESEVALWYE